MRNLKIFSDNVDGRAREQIELLLDQPAFCDAKVRIMPDVHAGIGCVIGFTGDLCIVVASINRLALWAVAITKIIKPIYNFKAAE